MRNVLVGIAGLLMLAMPAFGLTGLSVTGPATVADPSQPIPIEINLTFAEEEVGAWNANLQGPGLKIEAYKGGANHYAAGWDQGLNASGWDTVNPVDLPVWLGTFHATGSATSGLLFHANLFAAAPGQYTVSLTDWVIGSALSGEEIQSPNDTVTGFMVEVLPEPVSALLLLAGLPMLRRRR